ncbi:MAG: protein N-lysine methyltransferase family protein [Planctomycetaceae bacterium]|nr:protein N-lysine methyltransferase family protein [Planctomycetaceae bacterium]
MQRPGLTNKCGERHAALPSSKPSIANLAIPGGWTEREVTVGSHTFRLLTPADPDEFLNHLAEPADTSQPHLADPYWAKLWPAATFLAEIILREAWPQAGPKSKVQGPMSDFGLWTLDFGPACLELGCGSGLAALAAGYDVTFSDYVPQAVQLAIENAARNGFPGAKGLVLDWRQPPDRQFPLIVAADVTYDRANIEPLLWTIERMLAPGGEAWLGDAGRGPAAEFLQLAQDRGWSVSLWDEHGRQAIVPALGRCQRIVLRRASV